MDGLQPPFSGALYRPERSTLKSEDPLFEDLGQHFDSWLSSATDSVSDPSANLDWSENEASISNLGKLLRDNDCIDDYRKIVSELLIGILHSSLVTFDGGTALSEESSLEIVNEHGQTLPKNLNELFISFLIETGRLKP